MEKKGLFTQEEIREFQIRRQITSLYKTFLVMVEDLEEEHLGHFEKLYQTFKENRAVIEQADYLSEDKVNYLRKKILDAGNDCIRKITGENKNG